MQHNILPFLVLNKAVPTLYHLLLFICIDEKTTTIYELCIVYGKL